MGDTITFTGYEEIIASFTYKTFESEDRSFCVFRYKNHETQKGFTAVGSMLPDQKNLAVKLTGFWELDKKSARRQFKVVFCEKATPSGEAEVAAYFVALKCGIGKVKARTIWKHFGRDTWDIIENNPERLLEVPTISRKILARFEDSRKNDNIFRELLKLFSQAGVSIGGDTLHALADKLGPEALRVIRENPYYPYGRFHGFSFDKSDALAITLGFPPDCDARLSAAIRKVLEDAAASGHACLPKDLLLKELIRLSGCSRNRCIEAIQKDFRDKKLLGANCFLYSPHRYEQEESICDNLIRLMTSGNGPIQSVDAFITDCEKNGFSFAESQKEAIRNVFLNQVSVITGGPGVGKTTVTKGVLAVHDGLYGESSKPILLAPTGKAARRLSEATGYPAQTIHSAVGWKGEEFNYNDRPNMLDGNLVIIDECSMMDQQITAMLLERIRTGTRLVLVGDVDQLPCVGCGNVLCDIIDSGIVPTTRLTVIFRQAGENLIVRNAHKVNNGDTSLQFGRQFRFIECSDEHEVFEAACRIYVRCVRAYGEENVILLNPQRNNTFVSVDRFNTELQARINPPVAGKMEIKIGKTVFREGDKVMELKNTESGPKNGDVGYIREITRRKSPEDPDLFNYFANIEWNNDQSWVEYNQDDMRHVTLAFCTTVHKAQGSEYKIVIEIVSRAHPSLLKKNLIYTGITRSKEAVCLVGELESLSRAILRDTAVEDHRYTLLASRLRTAMDGLAKTNKFIGKGENNAEIQIYSHKGHEGGRRL